MATEKLGSSISAALHSQLVARESLHSSLDRSKSTNQYLNSNNVWVKLSSSVNKATTDAVFKGSAPPACGSNSLAKSLVLTGGTLKGTDMRAGIGFGSKTSAGSTAYHNSPTTGFKPMPGITSVNVKAKNTFGTLKEATVKFKVFSREDLDDIETLYFRVGYTALLEYGHTVYLSNSKKVELATNSNTVGGFFGNSGNDTIPGQITKIRNSTNGNYDGIFGFISNFNWTLQSDGSYDCSVDIISKGIILEGLMTSNVSTHATTEEQKAEAKEKAAEEAQQEAKSIYAYIQTRLESVTADKREGGLIDLLKEAKANSFANQLSKNHPVVGFKASVGEGNYPFTRLFYNSNFILNYIQLGALLDIVNKFDMMKDHQGNTICNFDIYSQEQYRTFPNHFTCDPLNVILPKMPGGDFSFAKAEITADGKTFPLTAKAAEKGSSSLCTSIMVSTYLIKGTLEDLIDNPVEKGVGVYEFLKNLLAQINFSLGGINTLDIHYDDDTKTHTVVDRGMPPKGTRPREIKVSGLSTTVSDISVVSEITSEMKSMVSIAAQGNTGNYNDDMSNLLKFNKGCVDRHNWSKGQDKNGNSKTAQQKAAEDRTAFIERFKKAWENLNKKQVINPEYWSELRNEASSELNRSYQFYAAKNNKSSGIPIPIRMNLTLKGISGFKIGSTFTVNTDIIPSKYKSFAFYVMGVDHTIDNGGWSTNVSAYLRNI